MDNDYFEIIQMMIEWGNAINNGDFKIANRKYKSIVVLIKKINNYDPIERIITKLLARTEVSVKYWAFVIALKNGVNEDIAERGLTELANSNSTGPIGVLARIGILEWNKQKATNSE